MRLIEIISLMALVCSPLLKLCGHILSLLLNASLELEA